MRGCSSHKGFKKTSHRSLRSVGNCCRTALSQGCCSAEHCQCHLGVGQCSFHYAALRTTGLFSNIPAPAYLSDDNAYVDFSSICDKDCAKGDPTRRTYLAHLSRVRVRDIRNTPVREWLMAATTLDGPQATALIAGMTQEFSLIQGPPGTGEQQAWTSSRLHGQTNG